MRNIPAALATHINGEVTSLTKVFTITRIDNKVFRLTSHDRDLVISGDTFLATPGVTVSALESSDDLTVDNAEVTFGIDGTTLVADDFKLGLFDRAQFEYSLVNWEDLSQGRIYMKRGELGDITVNLDETSVTLQLRGLTQALQRTVVEKYSPTCRVNLGGKKCGVVNVPTRIRRNRQRCRTFDWFLVPDANITTYAGSNLGFESDGAVGNGTSGISNWDYGTGSYWQVVSAFAAGEGTFYLAGGNDGLGAGTGTEFELSQTKTTAAIGMANVDIDAGSLSFDVQTLIAGTSNTDDNPGRISIEQFDNSGNSLQLIYSDYVTPVYQEWEGTGLTVFVLPGCRSIKYTLRARKNQGNTASVAFDDVRIRFFTNTLATYGSRVFRTMRIPSFSTSEAVLLANSSFETGGAHANGTSGIPGWTYGAGAYWRTVASFGAFSPISGGFLLQGGDNGTTTPAQVYTFYQEAVIPGNPTAQHITDGWYAVYASVWAGRSDDSDVKLEIAFYDDTTLLSTVSTGYAAPTVNTWTKLALTARVPSTATKYRIILTGKSGSGGSAANVVFDDASIFSMITAYEQDADNDYGRLANEVPTYDYTTGDYSLDGEVLVNAQLPVFDFTTVTAVTDTRTFNASAINETAALMYSGKIVWLSGNNAGAVSYVRIWDNTAKQARLYNDLRHTIQVGDKFCFSIGCDKTIDRCADTFLNATNFRGEPYLPGPAKVIEFLTENT